VTLTADFTEKMKKAINESADEFIDYCKKLHDAYNMSFSWQWFVKGVKVLPKYNCTEDFDNDRTFSTPMGTVGFSPFSRIVGRAAYECNYWLSFTINTRKIINQAEFIK